MKFKFIPLCLAAIATCIACDDNHVTSVGSSLAGTTAKIVIDSAYTIEGKTVTVDAINPKTTQELLGKINVDKFGTLGSDFVCQFLPATVLDTANYSYSNVDSLYLTLSYSRGAFIGDSVVPMGLTVYQLNRELPQTLESNFNPEGYYNTTPLATKTYNASTLNNPTVGVLTYRNINVKLPTQLGRDIFRSFEEHPEYFVNGKTFTEKVFPGLYIKSSFGSGRMTLITVNSFSFYLSKITPASGDTPADTISGIHQYMVVAPEVANNNTIRYDMSPYLKEKISSGAKMLIAPLGSEVEFKMPGKELAENYRTGSQGLGVLNSLSLSIPVDSIENTDGVTPPPYVLLVLKKDRDAFFAQNKLPDNKTSFYASYNTTYKSYNFSSLRSYLTELLAKDEITDEDCLFSLVPVQVNFEQTVNSGYYSSSESVVSEILPYLTAPVMAELDLENAKIKLSYSLMPK